MTTGSEFLAGVSRLGAPASLYFQNFSFLADFILYEKKSNLFVNFGQKYAYVINLETQADSGWIKIIV